MKLSLAIARRYLFGKKSTNAINIISWISVSGVAIGTAALFLILSVFNGFESLISGLFNSFNPDLIVTPYEGKVFDDDPEIYAKLAALDGIEIISKTIEEIVLFQYDKIQEVGQIKGVDENFNAVTAIDSTIRKGAFVLNRKGTNYGVAGVGMANKLGLSIEEGFTPINAYIPRLNSFSPFSKKYNSSYLYPSGTFSVQTEQDYSTIIADLTFVQKLREEEGKIGAYEIKVDEAYDQVELRLEMTEILGDSFVIKNRFEQDEVFLKLMNIEKWVSFTLAGFAFILIAFNLVGCLWMIVLDKRKDISILKSMGFTSNNVQLLFLIEGLLICLLGILIGLTVSFILYFLQKQFGIIGIPEGFIIDAYPAEIKWTDLVVVSFTVLIIGFLASIPGSIRAKKVKPYFREE